MAEARAGAEIDFRTTSLADLSRSVRAKEISAHELTQAALDRIERLDPTYNAFVAVDGRLFWLHQERLGRVLASSD